MELIKLFESLLNGEQPEIRSLQQLKEIKKRQEFLKSLGLPIDYKIKFKDFQMK